MDYIVVIGIFVLIFAYAVQGISGFGKSLVATPILSFFIPANEVIAIMILTGLLANFYMLLKTFRYSNIRKIWVMILLGIGGVMTGVRVLSFVPVKELKIAMGVMVVISAILLASGYKLRIKEGHFAYGAAGLTSGFLSGLLSMGGPAIVLFLQNQDHEKHEFRGNLTLFFFFTGIFAIASLFMNHLVTSDVISKSLFFLPASLIGVFLGNYLSHKINEKVFKKIIILILFLAGISAVITSFL
ncbi:MAG: sulfite exporter TauE/SafE family protein [Clostridia bacterium]|nr:sulfite exporter TauE/SafE family protein [Clostridia bacterium]